MRDVLYKRFKRYERLRKVRNYQKIMLWDNAQDVNERRLTL
jgi:hypothetical protein